MKEHEEPEYESQEQSEDILLPKGCEEDLQFEEVNDESIDDEAKFKEEF